MSKSHRPLGGSHPEEQYAPATREKMFLDRPTSHGGWPEGEYDPPIRDRIYGWYKKMKMMPEGDEPTMRSVRSSEQRRDLQKGRYGHRLGYQQDPKSQEIARDLALRIMSPEESGNALEDVMQNPHLAMNVWSELQSEGEYALAKLVRPIADEYVAQRGKHMRITESMLRRIIREEYTWMTGETPRNDQAVLAMKSNLPGNKQRLADMLAGLGVVGEKAILDQLDYAFDPIGSEGQSKLQALAKDLAGMQPALASAEPVKESARRRMARRGYGMLNEVTEEKKKEAFAAVADAVKRADKNPANQEAELSKLADKLIEMGVTDDTTISDAFNATIGKSPKPGEGQALGSQRDSMATQVIEMIAQKKSMKEGQRGNDENSQHDNDTDPGDPYAKKLKESRRLALRRAVLAEMRRRGII